MNNQKKDRKYQTEIVHKDRGDMFQKHRKELQTNTPRDRGDVKIKGNKKITTELPKTKPEKAESLKISKLVSRSTNTVAESVPVSFESRVKHVDVGSEKCDDFRKRIKARYTFKPPQKVERKDGDISKFNYVMQCDVKNELPKTSYFESSETQKPKESRDVKKSERVKDKQGVHRAVSAMKLKPTKPVDDLAERKKDVDKEKTRNPTRKDRRKPVIKTITSKMDTVRVFKAVTFVENVPRKPLQIKIPSKDPKAKKSRIPVSIVSKTVPNTKRTKKFVKAERVHSPSTKSADSLPTEVAQWVPESINKHTKPYYEAWVNKTATASTKFSKDEMESVKSSVLRSLGIRKSPELVYQRLEEEYAGKIRVRRRGRK